MSWRYRRCTKCTIYSVHHNSPLTWSSKHRNFGRNNLSQFQSHFQRSSICICVISSKTWKLSLMFIQIMWSHSRDHGANVRTRTVSWLFLNFSFYCVYIWTFFLLLQQYSLHGICLLVIQFTWNLPTWNLLLVIVFLNFSFYCIYIWTYFLLMQQYSLHGIWFHRHYENNIQIV